VSKSCTCTLYRQLILQLMEELCDCMLYRQLILYALLVWQHNCMLCIRCDVKAQNGCDLLQHPVGETGDIVICCNTLSVICIFLLESMHTDSLVLCSQAKPICAACFTLPERSLKQVVTRQDSQKQGLISEHKRSQALCCTAAQLARS